MISKLIKNQENKLQQIPQDHSNTLSKIYASLSKAYSNLSAYQKYISRLDLAIKNKAKINV